MSGSRVFEKALREWAGSHHRDSGGAPTEWQLVTSTAKKGPADRVVHVYSVAMVAACGKTFSGDQYWIALGPTREITCKSCRKRLEHLWPEMAGIWPWSNPVII